MVEKIPAEDARQGRRGTKVLVVLVVALAIALGAWVLLEAAFN